MMMPPIFGSLPARDFLSPALDAREVKAGADFFAIASRYMRLRRSGRQFVGLCPFHSERHPSFYIHPEKKIFYCFGCGTGGDLFDFVMRVEGCDFLAALRIVAEFSSGVAAASGLRSSPRLGSGVGASPGLAKQGGVHRWDNAPRPFAVAGSWPSLECAVEAAAEVERGEVGPGRAVFSTTQRITSSRDGAVALSALSAKRSAV
jgi:CHC2 zinc finger